MKQGTLFYDRESGRYNFFYTDGDGDRRDYGGIHCGEVFDFRLNGVWVPARVEMCYPQLVGTIQLSGGRRHVKKYIWSF